MTKPVIGVVVPATGVAIPRTPLNVRYEAVDREARTARTQVVIDAARALMKIIERRATGPRPVPMSPPERALYDALVALKAVKESK